MDNLRGFLGIRRMDTLPYAQIRELWGGVNESVLHWIGHIKRMENDRIAKRVCVWIDHSRLIMEEVD